MYAVRTIYGMLRMCSKVSFYSKQQATSTQSDEEQRNWIYLPDERINFNRLQQRYHAQETLFKQINAHMGTIKKTFNHILFEEKKTSDEHGNRQEEQAKKLQRKLKITTKKYIWHRAATYNSVFFSHYELNFIQRRSHFVRMILDIWSHHIYLYAWW